MKTLLLLALVLNLSERTLAQPGSEDCNGLLKNPMKAAVAALELGLERISHLKMMGQGVAWREKRFEKRRVELIAAFSSGNFRKQVASKPEIARSVEMWAVALDRVPEIDQAFAGLTDLERKTFQPGYDAVRAALTSHALSWSKASVRHLDHLRMQLILKQISEFDASRPKFSLYRLKRAIEMRYSLRDYVECR